CERLAYRATELQAAQALLHYTEMQGQHGQDDGVTGHMALAYAAEVHQTLLAEVGAHLTTYGMDAAHVAATLDAAEVRQEARVGASEALVLRFRISVLVLGLDLRLQWEACGWSL